MNEEATTSGGAAEASAERRGFLKGLVGVLAAATGLVLGLPVVRALFVTGAGGASPWSRVGSVGDLPPGTPVEMTFETVETDAYLRTSAVRSVWAVRSAGDRVDAFSPVCPHLGCHFAWNPASARFECPCHASVFAIDGRVLGGPAPRALDALPSRIENGVLFVRWTQYRAGTPEKTAV
jgi:Rieske Fe-S protein